MRLEDDMSFGKRTEARMLAKFAVSDPLLEIVAVSIVRAHLSTVVVNRHLRSFRHNAGFIPGATLAERFRLRRVKRVNRAGRMGQFNGGRFVRLLILMKLVVENLDLNSGMPDFFVVFRCPKENSAVTSVGDLPFNHEFKVAVLFPRKEIGHSLRRC